MNHLSVIKVPKPLYSHGLYLILGCCAHVCPSLLYRFGPLKSRSRTDVIDHHRLKGFQIDSAGRVLVGRKPDHYP